MSQPLDDDGTPSEDVIREARRPIIIDRHRRLIEEMESSLADSWVSGETDHPRLKAMLADLDLGSEQARVRRTFAALADARYRDSVLRAALVEELCLLREHAKIEIAALQLHAIGIYRTVRKALIGGQGEAPALSELRELPVQRLVPLTRGEAPTGVFGNPNLVDTILCTPAFAERCLATFRRLIRPEIADAHWDDAQGPPPLPRNLEEPLLALPEGELKAARLMLIRERIRSRFYRQVFLEFLSKDELDPHEVESHPTVLNWLLGIEATAHLYPFMQGQTAEQKAFRLGQLTQKIVQLHEVSARVTLAANQGGYAERFAGKNLRDRLAILAADRYPALALTRELTLAALLCSFSKLVRWVQDRIESKDFLIPPDPRR